MQIINIKHLILHELPYTSTAKKVLFYSTIQNCDLFAAMAIAMTS